MNIGTSNRNDRLCKRSTYSGIHWLSGCGKSHLVLDLIGKEYHEHSDYIIIICPRLPYHTNHTKGWIKHDDQFSLIEPT